MSAGRLGGSWLLGTGVGLTALALARGNFGALAVPFLLGAAGFLLVANSRPTPGRFPGSELERGLDRLFALLLPAGRAATTSPIRASLLQARHLAGLRRGARRWGRELQLITTDGYETASRLSASHDSASEHDDRVLVAEVVRVLCAERAGVGADLPLAADPVSLLAFGLGARPAGADLTSLDDLLHDLGLAGEGDELRTHCDEVIAAGSGPTVVQLRNDAQRSMFRDLAGASFVLGAATRILELASLAATRDGPIRAAEAV